MYWKKKIDWQNKNLQKWCLISAIALLAIGLILNAFIARYVPLESSSACYLDRWTGKIGFMK